MIGCLKRFPRLIQVYSDGKIDAYIDEQTLNEAIKFQIADTFGAHLYFVYQDESARQEAIASIERHTLNNPPDKQLKDLKYIFLNIGFTERGMFGIVTPDGLPVPGPVIQIGDIRYLSPMGYYNDDYFLPKQGDYPRVQSEVIVVRNSPEYIDVETPGWDLFLGYSSP